MSQEKRTAEIEYPDVSPPPIGTCNGDLPKSNDAHVRRIGV